MCAGVIFVCYDGEVVDKYRGHIYGLAIDLGTTTVVVDLVDLETGKSVHTSSFLNPQAFGGSDVMHRISYDGGAFRGELQKAIVSSLNREIRAMGERLGFPRQEIYEIVVAGNSTMRDIFFKLDVQSIGQKPYKSTVEHDYLEGKRETTALLQSTRRLGLRAHPKAKVYGLSLIASHVGGDVAADLVAIDMEAQRDIVMLVDVGTNTEVVLGHAGRMMAASCPAGPAFEGGLIKYGMPGFEGAIESFRLGQNSHFEYQTIGGLEPQGICGVRIDRSAGGTATRRPHVAEGRVCRQSLRADGRARPRHHLFPGGREQPRPGKGGELLWTVYRDAELWRGPVGNKQALSLRRVCKLRGC